LVEAAQRKLREFAESPELPPIFSKQVSMFADAEMAQIKQPVATKTVNFDNQNKTNFAKMLKDIRKQWHKAVGKDQKPEQQQSFDLNGQSKVITRLVAQPKGPEYGIISVRGSPRRR